MPIRPLEGSWSGSQRPRTGAGLPPDQTPVFQRRQPEELLLGFWGVIDWAPKGGQLPKLKWLRDEGQLQEVAKDLDHVGP